MLFRNSALHRMNLDALYKSNQTKGYDKCATAVTHEGQHKPGNRNKSEIAPNIDNKLQKKYGNGSKDNKGGEVIIRGAKDACETIKQEHPKKKKRENTDEPKLFRNN